MADPAWRKLWSWALRRRGLLIPPLLFILALLPRLSAIRQGFITTDELEWLYHSARFAHAIETGRRADTLPDGGNGVITLWIGTLSILYARQQSPTATADHLAWIAPVFRFDPQNVALATHLAPFLPVARAILALVNALGVVGLYMLAGRLWDQPTALLTGLLIALDPFTVARSGLLNADAPMTTLAVLSMLAWFNALKLPGRPAWIGPVFALMSGMFAGVAILSHMFALFLLPATLISTVIWLVPGKNRPFKTVLLSGILWTIGLLGTVWGGLPAMWDDLPGTAGAYASFIVSRYAAHATMFDGSSPAAGFYLMASLLRLTPVTMIGLALSPLAPILDRRTDARRRRPAFVGWWLSIAVYGVLLALDAAPSEHHMLPLLLMLNLPAALGWSEMVRRLSDLFKRAAPTSVWAGTTLTLVLAQGAILSTGWPYYADVYNPLIGGINTAMRMLPVGHGEGLEQVAAYLNRLPNSETVVVAVTQPAILAPLFKGQTIPLEGHTHMLADYLIITVRDRQTHADIEKMVGDAQPVHTVHAGRAPIAWLYRTAYTAEASHLARFAAPTDLILCDAPTPFARHAADDLPAVRVVADADENEIVAMLNRWRASHTRLWYVASPAASPITAQAIRRQLDTYAVRLDVVELGYATITLYILPGEADFKPFDAPVSVWSWSALELTGIAFTRPTLPADGRVEFVSRWRAQGRPPTDISPYFYLTDEAGHIRSSIEHPHPLLNQYGYQTSAWQAGESCELGSDLPLPPGLPPGRYLLHVGLVASTPAYQDVTSAQIAQVEIGPAQTPPSPDALDFAQRPSIVWRSRLKLFGVDLPAHATPGQTVAIGIGWTATDRLNERYNIRLGLEGRDGYTVVTPLLPLSRFPTDQWRRGETLHEIYDLALPTDMPGGLYTLTIQVFDAANIALSPPVSLGETDIGAE